MNKYTLLLCIVLLAVFFSHSANGEVKLPSIFGNNMVLQQQTQAPIWGKTESGKSVSVKTSWDGKSYSVKSDNHGNWKVIIKTPKAGGPYTITISDGSTIKLTGVLIGEVWICSGQSNMEMSMKGYHNEPVIGGIEDIYASTNESIRLFTVSKNTSISPLDDFTGKWEECIPGNVANFSATAYYFGRMLQKSLGVPVGLINTSWGGTRIEPWISEVGNKTFDFVKLPDKNQAENITTQTPTVLYNAMIHPMEGYGIRGAIWYQGESNRNEYSNYEKLMPGLIQDWRNKWDIGDFPFYYVQIAPFNYGSGINSAFLREAQLKASTVLPNIGMISLMDTGEEFCIHPKNKRVCGERLAYYALAKTYGFEGVEYTGPVLKEYIIDGSVVKLKFNHANNGLTTFGKELKNFRIAGENKQFYPATATITGDGITVVSPHVVKPVAVRYAFDDFVVGELFNNEGFPASSFRTDNW